MFPKIWDHSNLSLTLPVTVTEPELLALTCLDSGFHPVTIVEVYFAALVFLLCFLIFYGGCYEMTPAHRKSVTGFVYPTYNKRTICRLSFHY